MMRPIDISVLLVDNDPHLCAVIEMIFELHALPCSCASSVQEALAFLTRNSVSVVIIDQDLPGTKGYEVLRRIRAEGIAPDSRFVATAADYSGSTAREMRERGFDGFIPKPFDVDTLIPYLKTVAGTVKH